MRNERETASAYRPTGFIVYRVAAFPIDEYLEWGANTPDARLSDQRASLVSRLLARLRDDHFDTAVFVASPSLHEAVKRPLDSDELPKARAIQALARYYARAAGRATPFGLFAAYGIGSVDVDKERALKIDADYEAHVTVDSAQIYAIAERVSSDGFLQQPYRMNPVCFQLGDRLKVAQRHLHGGAFRFDWSSVGVPAWLSPTLRIAEKYASRGELGDALMTAGVPPKDAEQLLSELIAQQVLLPLSAPVLTADDTYRSFKRQLQGATIPSEAGRALESLDRVVGVVRTADFRQIRERTETLFESSRPDRLPVQVDMRDVSGGVRVDAGIVAETMRCVHALWRVQPPRPDGRIEHFRRSFEAQFGEAEVPLLLALDAEAGVGYGTNRYDPPTITAGLQPGRASTETDTRFSKRERVLLSELVRSVGANGSPICLTDKLVDALASDQRPLPPGFCTVISTLSGESGSATAPVLLHRYTSGPSGGRLFGRFSQADSSLRSWVKRQAEAEQLAYSDCVVAEVVHFPAPRSGNVARRAPLYEYEIPAWGSSGAPLANQILPSDLWVSVHSSRIVLRSRRLAREVVPVFTTAMNHSNSRLKVVQFLFDLALSTHSNGLRWDWGGLESSPFLPRVVYGRSIVAPAQWLLQAEELPPLPSEYDARAHAAISALREKRGIPRLCAMVEGDNLLPIDFSNPLSVEAALAQPCRSRSAVRLEELSFDGALPTIAGKEGGHIHEIAIPFVVSPERSRFSAFQEVRPVPVRLQKHPPGSEWLMVKLFVGPFVADRILLSALKPLIDRGSERGAFRRWFYIRYGDPEWHLRLRFNGEPREIVGWWASECIPALRTLVDSSVIRRIEFGEYIPELRRYGGHEALSASEEIFHCTSSLALNVLTELCAHHGGDTRWPVAAKLMDCIYQAYGLALTERHSLCRSNFEAFLADSSVGQRSRERSMRNAIGVRFREYRRELEAAIIGKGTPAVANAITVIQESQPSLDRLFQQLRAARLATDRSHVSILNSHVHMVLNRLFVNHHREWETLLYGFLDRYYWSVRGREVRRRGAVELPAG